MSDSVRPHRRQPIRLPSPWDSPGKNTGVGCHFLLQCMKVKSEREVTQLCPTLVTPWTAAYKAPLSMGFSRQEYWTGVPLPSPRATAWYSNSSPGCIFWASQVSLMVKSLPASAGAVRDLRSIPRLGRSLREGSGYPLQYSCLENPLDREAWWATQSQTGLKQLSTHNNQLVSKLRHFKQ